MKYSRAPTQRTRWSATWDRSVAFGRRNPVVSHRKRVDLFVLFWIAFCFLFFEKNNILNMALHRKRTCSLWFWAEKSADIATKMTRHLWFAFRQVE